MIKTLNFQDSVTALVALLSSIRQYHNNALTWPQDRRFWLSEAAKHYRLYRCLGGMHRYCVAVTPWGVKI
jgi:hypothetical protein